MKKKKETPQINYLDMIPSHNIENWQTAEDGIVTLMVENSGLFNSIAQKIFKNRNTHRFIWIPWAVFSDLVWMDRKALRIWLWR